MYFDPMLSKSDLITSYLVFGIIPVFYMLIRFISHVMFPRRRGKG